MLDFTWKFFCMTGNIDTYLLFKEMEGFNELDNEVQVEDETENGSTLH
ncbi:YqzL family protein [Pueribacillus theae]|uniref:YqzL family protein n=1 Tax=Pueribacillus theae TaxID=2171751 RepID=A0A2U1K671_9BACI|nr:YqzL family protein [Pueribacillus theae]PWA12463.1 YqzL family protein [Pueribacillus theae]